MNKKGESTPADLFLGFAVFVFIALAGLIFFSSALTDTEATTSSSIAYTSLENNLNDLSISSQQISNSSQKTPDINGLDILAMGWDSIKKIGDLTKTGKSIISWVQEDTPLGQVPAIFWNFVSTSLFIIVAFTLIGAVWRYRMKK